MKTHKFFIFVAIAVFAFALKVHAFQTERILTITLSGYFQSRDAFNNDLAVPFRKTTKDFLEELSIVTQQDLTNGVLVVVNGSDPTNNAQIFARKGTNVSVDVSNFFEITPETNNFVQTIKLLNGAFKSATIYAIDEFRFDTLSTDTNGVDVTIRGLSKEMQLASTKIIGGIPTAVVASSIKTDGFGEYFDGLGFLGPVKGTITIGKPKFFP